MSKRGSGTRWPMDPGTFDSEVFGIDLGLQSYRLRSVEVFGSGIELSHWDDNLENRGTAGPLLEHAMPQSLAQD